MSRKDEALGQTEQTVGRQSSLHKKKSSSIVLPRPDEHIATDY